MEMCPRLVCTAPLLPSSPSVHTHKDTALGLYCKAATGELGRLEVQAKEKGVVGSILPKAGLLAKDNLSPIHQHRIPALFLLPRHSTDTHCAASLGIRDFLGLGSRQLGIAATRGGSGDVKSTSSLQNVGESLGKG